MFQETQILIRPLLALEGAIIFPIEKNFLLNDLLLKGFQMGFCSQFSQRQDLILLGVSILYLGALIGSIYAWGNSQGWDAATPMSWKMFEIICFKIDLKKPLSIVYENSINDL